jgi:hypothetical protein
VSDSLLTQIARELLSQSRESAAGFMSTDEEPRRETTRGAAGSRSGKGRSSRMAD